MTYTIENIDSFEYMKTIPDNSIDLIVTDPPYDLMLGNGGTIKEKFNTIINDLPKDNLVDGYDIVKFNKEFVRIMKGINIYIWCNKLQIPDYFNFYVNELGCKFEIICWHKSNAIPAFHNKYLSDTEYCLYFHKGAYLNPASYEEALTYYFAPINLKDKKKFKHPTIKPIDVIRRLIRNSSKEGDTIFDPFMGSGTTGVGCVEENRNFIGCEINTEYFNIAKERIEHTVKKVNSKLF